MGGFTSLSSYQHEYKPPQGQYGGVTTSWRLAPSILLLRHPQHVAAGLQAKMAPTIISASSP